ncbi:hypothetical protein EDB83DRAFT_2481620 [Lactarius deliciosus]|nr:hypothetical protein EDB83DRAFT_2481620 [Lactarius deliciosus]
MLPANNCCAWRLVLWISKAIVFCSIYTACRACPSTVGFVVNKGLLRHLLHLGRLEIELTCTSFGPGLKPSLVDHIGSFVVKCFPPGSAKSVFSRE